MMTRIEANALLGTLATSNLMRIEVINEMADWILQGRTGSLTWHFRQGAVAQIERCEKTTLK